jgi:predicted CXXCH cytochrome family protein
MARCGRWAVALVVGVLSLSGCVDEQIVYRDKPLFDDPPAAAVGFLGYSDTTAQRTTCGNCHVGQQGRWKTSAHASAVKDLVASGRATESCYSCHTVTELGNATKGVAIGYAATKSPRYKDVQCESCHNGGLAHVQDPSRTQPMASIVVDTALTNGCGECHQGTHHPYVNEWRESGHGRLTPSIAAALASDPVEREECGYCHEGKEALEVQFRVEAEFVEKDDGKVYPITCAVCHDPHGSAETAQLRASIESRNPEENLCIKCHHKRSEPDESGRGAHSPQGPLVLGDAGWRPPNFVYKNAAMETTHGSERNPKLCAGCHVQSFTVDATTNATGHLFGAIPCLNSAGKPVAGECDIQQKRFRTCASAGCHGSENAARSALVANEARLTALSTETNRLVALVPKTEFSTTDGKTTVGEGAKFNASILSGDRSRGVHNPFLLEALLLASIDVLKTTYNIK